MHNGDRIIDRELITELTALTQHYKSLSVSDGSGLTRDDVFGFIKALQAINPEETTYSQMSKLAKQGRELLLTLSTPEQQAKFTFVSDMLQRLKETKAYQATDKIRGAHIAHIAKFLPLSGLMKLADVNIDFEEFSEIERLGQLLFLRITEGNERAIKVILEKYPGLMRYRGNITNALGQTFKNVNAFELALHPHQRADLTVRGTLSDAEEAKRRVDAIFTQLYSEEIKQAVKENLGPQLLHHAIRGNQQAVVEILTRYPELLKYRGNIVDESGREFKDVTAFELVLWALDVHHMAPAMLTCVTQNRKGEELGPELSKQYKAVTREGGGVTYTIGCGLLKMSEDPRTLLPGKMDEERYAELNRKLNRHDGLIQYEDKLFYFHNLKIPKELVEITDSDAVNALKALINKEERKLEVGKLQIINRDYELKIIQENVSDSRHIFRENHYDFKPLIDALDMYAHNFDPGNTWTWDKLNAPWCSVVGLAQHYAPAHVAQHYCNPDESFAPQNNDTPPTFKEKELRRVLEFYNWLSSKKERWGGSAVAARIPGSASMPDSRHGPGLDFGIVRACSGTRAQAGKARLGMAGFMDLAALTVLCKVRTDDALELKELLDSLQKPETGSEPARDGPGPA